jgi:hypothetical protein
MGERPATVASGKENDPRSHEADNVSVGSEEDRRRSKSPVGEGQGGTEEGRIVPRLQAKLVAA